MSIELDVCADRDRLVSRESNQRAVFGFCRALVCGVAVALNFPYPLRYYGGHGIGCNRTIKEQP